MTMRLLLPLAVLLVSCSVLPRGPAGSRYVEKLDSMPDFFQADKSYGELPRGGGAYCGPTAVANALVWLDGNGFDKLLPADKPGPAEQLELIRLLGTPEYMKADEVKGTGPAGIMNGIERYCRERGYTARLEYAGWRTRSHRIAERPATDWMLRRVEGHSNLVVNVGWYKAGEGEKAYVRTGGHYLTVVGYEQQEGQVWLILHDPAKRSQPNPRNSTTRCPVRCLLKPLPEGTTLHKKEGGGTFAGDGLATLDGLRLKKGCALAVLDGAIAFQPLAE